MLYILLGQDDFSRGELVNQIKQGIGDPTTLEANTTILEGQQITPEGLRAVCGTVPFLSEKRLVIAKGLLTRFEPRVKPSRLEKTATASRQNEVKLLADYINHIPSTTLLVLIDDKAGNNNPLFKELAPIAEVKSFSLLRGAKLDHWTEERVLKEGGTISPRAVKLLGRVVGSNLWIMYHEINKLILFASGQLIEEEDVRKLVSYAQQDSVFAMIDAIIGFKPGIAERILQRLLERGAAPGYLLAMLARQIRLMVRIKELKQQRKSEKEIQHRLGITHEFAFRKALEQAGRYPLRRIKEIYPKLLEADLSIKTGRYSSELALNILVAELCQRHH
ncbi:MAG: DNA polymerase III subunit delta [Dehalococcoidales bacterium]|nr:DNA polymerase III subunit delta [Dehalococcoidales bacterium]